MSLGAGVRLGQYEVITQLGAGGMGEVYLARHERLGRLVALKVLSADVVSDPGRKRRFVLEAQAASALNHPGIVTIYDIGEEAGMDFIAMEFVEGSTLEQLIPRKGLPLRETLNYAIQAAAALAKAHAAGIVHRDLKPSNIMVTEDGVVKILDFGLAKLMMAPQSESDIDGLASTKSVTVGGTLITGHGKVVGTAAYMSPEQAEGKKVDPRSDIFSLGSLMYEMVTGARAFRGDSSVSTLSAVLSIEPRPITEVVPTLPRELERIILRCLRKDPSKRFQATADLVVELGEVQAESGTEIAPLPTGVRPGVRRGLIAAAIAGVLATAGVAGFWLSRPAPFAAPTVVPLTSYPGDESSPDLSPDGIQVVFAWNGEAGVNTDIYITQPGEGTPRRLTFDAARDISPAWSPDGSRIAFVRDSIGGDGRDYERTGAPQHLAALYTMSPGAAAGSERKLGNFIPPLDLKSVSWLPDGKRLAVAQRRPNTDINEIAFIRPEAFEHTTVIAAPIAYGRFVAPTVSPDGKSVGYSLCKGVVSNPSCDLYVLDLNGPFPVERPPRRLTTDGSFTGRLAWTADSRTLIVRSTADGLHLWRVPVSGAPRERIELAGTPASSPSVSHTSHTLVFSRSQSNIDIWKLLPGPSPEPFASSNLNDEDPQFSPDGRRIAFASVRSGSANIWVGNLDGSNLRNVTTQAKRLVGSPRWSPDGRWIAYDAQGPDGSWDVMIIEEKGGAPYRLTNHPNDENVPSWSRDGKWVYFRSNRTGQFEIFRIPREGGDSIQMTPGGGSGPWESTDGSVLYYTKQTALYSLPSANPQGPESRVTGPIYNSDFFPVETGIYYIAQLDEQKTGFELRFFDTGTRATRTLLAFQAEGGHGLTVSPDRKTVLYSGAGTSAGGDLMMIQNFR